MTVTSRAGAARQGQTVGVRGGGLPESEVSQRGEGLRPGAQAAPLLFLALVTGSQLPTLSPGLGRVPSGAGKREEVGMPWLRTCPD